MEQNPHLLCYHTFARSSPILRTFPRSVPGKRINEYEITEVLFPYLINDERQMNQAGDASRRLRERVRYKFPGIGEASSAFESHLETDFE